jgi:hypothetical protein
MGGKSALHFDRSASASAGGGEDCKKAVSFRASLRTAVGSESGADYFVVL